MSHYLDIDNFPDFLNRNYGGESNRHQRLVGVDGKYESWYNNITRFFGEKPIDPSQIGVKHLPSQFTLSDPIIIQFAQEVAANMKAEGRLFEGPPCAYIHTDGLYSSERSITIQPASYLDQAGTSFAMDLKHHLFEPHGGTLREYCLSKYSRGKAFNFPLCRCLGACAYVVCEQEETLFLLQVKRSSRLASLENSYGPSVAGSVDYSSEYKTLSDIFSKTILEELKEELALSPDDCTLIPLGFAYEIFRGERPQLFGMVKTKLNRSEISIRLDTLDSDQREFTDFDFLPLTGGKLETRAINNLNFEARMNYHLIEEFLHSGYLKS